MPKTVIFKDRHECIYIISSIFKMSSVHFSHDSWKVMILNRAKDIHQGSMSFNLESFFLQ